MKQIGSIFTKHKTYEGKPMNKDIVGKIFDKFYQGEEPFVCTLYLYKNQVLEITQKEEIDEKPFMRLYYL